MGPPLQESCRLSANWYQIAYSDSLNSKRCILLPAALVLEIKDQRKGDEKMVETRQAVLADQACCAAENPVHAGQAQDVVTMPMADKDDRYLSQGYTSNLKLPLSALATVNQYPFRAVANKD